MPLARFTYGKTGSRVVSKNKIRVRFERSDGSFPLGLYSLGIIQRLALLLAGIFSRVEDITVDKYSVILELWIENSRPPQRC